MNAEFQSLAHTRWKLLFCFVQVLLNYNFWHPLNIRSRTLTIKLGGPLKAIQKKIEIDFFVIMGFQLYCKDICDLALNQIFYYYYLICVGSFHTVRTYSKSLGLWDFEVRIRTRLFEVGLTQNLINRETLSNVTFHVFICSNFLGPLGPQALLCAMWNETVLAFATDERFYIQMGTCTSIKCLLCFILKSCLWYNFFGWPCFSLKFSTISIYYFQGWDHVVFLQLGFS